MENLKTKLLNSIKEDITKLKEEYNSDHILTTKIENLSFIQGSYYCKCNLLKELYGLDTYLEAYNIEREELKELLHNIYLLEDSLYYQVKGV